MNDQHSTKEKMVVVATATTTTEALPIIAQRKIGGTTYIVSTSFKEKGEGLLDKIWRLIENDAD